MSENTQTEPKKQELNETEIIKNSVFANPVEVTKNGITKILKILVGTRPQSKFYGIPYGVVEIEHDPSIPDTDLTRDSNFINGLIFTGKENVVNAINLLHRRASQDALIDATDENGKFSLAAFVKELIEAAVSPLRKSELKELYDKKMSEFVEFSGVYTSEGVMKNLAVLPLKAAIDSGTATQEQIDEFRSTEFYQKYELPFLQLKSDVESLRIKWEKRNMKKSQEVAVDSVRPE